MSLLGRSSLLAVIIVAVSATTASAHPGFRPPEVPAGGPVEVELVIPHGCGSEGGEPAQGEAASPTVEVAVAPDDGFAIDAVPTTGWTARVTEGAVGWFAENEGEAEELVLPAIVEVDGEVGSTVDVAVYQECANGEFVRWAAGQGEEGDPAVSLTIAPGEPEPLPTPTATPEPSPTPTPEDTEASPSPTSAAPTASASPSGSPTASPTPAPTPSATLTAAAVDPDDDGGGLNPVIWIPLAVAVAAALYAASRRGTGAAGATDGTGGTDGDGGAGGTTGGGVAT